MSAFDGHTYPIITLGNGTINMDEQKDRLLCVCARVSGVFLSPLSDGFCLVPIGMTAFLGHVLCFDTFRFLQ